MALRNGHGNGAGVPRIEVLPPDELPQGVQAPEQAPGTSERRPDGTFAPGASTVQSQGGKARRGATRLARRLRLGDSFAAPGFEPYAAAARDFRRAHVTRLAREVGGGVCGPGPASMVASAALQLAASRYAFEVLGDMSLGSKLANDSRQNLLAAHELCAKEALARPRDPADHHRRAAELFAAAPVTLPAAASADTKTTRGPSSDESRSEGQPEVSNRNSDTGATGVQE